MRSVQYALRKAYTGMQALLLEREVRVEVQSMSNVTRYAWII